MSTRRNAFAQQYSEPPEKNSTHAGLWLDKFVCHQEREQKRCRVFPNQDHEPKRLLVKQVSEIKEPSGYSSLYKRWMGTLASLNARKEEASLIGEGRLAIGLGAENVLENSLAI